MNSRIPAALAAMALFVALAACRALHKTIEPRWAEASVPSRSDTVIYDVIHLSLEKAGYPIGMGADKGRREVITGWYQSDAPFKGQGYRQKATVIYTPDGSDRFAVRVRVQRETNESLRPLDPRYAEWEEAEDNFQEAERILQYVRSFLNDGSDFQVRPRTSTQG